MLSVHEKASRLDDAGYISRRFILALCTYREARGETKLGKKMVAQVVENRVQDPRWPDTYSSVILQPYQFSSFNSNDSQSKIFPPTSYDSTPNMSAWNDCWEVAGEVLDEPEDITKGANHYFADSIPAPAWATKDKFIVKVGHHEFYRL